VLPSRVSDTATLVQADERAKNCGNKAIGDPAEKASTAIARRVGPNDGEVAACADRHDKTGVDETTVTGRLDETDT